jgi:hypothetical protein
LTLPLYGHQRALLQQPHHGQRGHGLAGAAFADHAQRFAFAYLQRDAVDDAFAAGLLAEADDEIVDVEDDVFHVSLSAVIACDKREAFAQGSGSDEAIHSFLRARWIASLRSQ